MYNLRIDYMNGKQEIINNDITISDGGNRISVIRYRTCPTLLEAEAYARQLIESKAAIEQDWGDIMILENGNELRMITVNGYKIKNAHGFWEEPSGSIYGNDPVSRL